MSCPLLFVEKLQLRRNEDFPGDPVMRTSLPAQEVWIQTLVRELRFHMPRG